MSRNRALAGSAFLGGLVVGLLVWSGIVFRSRRQLFGRSRVKRLAALTYVGRRPSIESARLLRDYVAWETRPELRRRGERVLREMELHLE